MNKRLYISQLCVYCIYNQLLFTDNIFTIYLCNNITNEAIPLYPYYSIPIYRSNNNIHRKVSQRKALSFQNWETRRRRSPTRRRSFRLTNLQYGQFPGPGSSRRGDTRKLSSRLLSWSFPVAFSVSGVYTKDSANYDYRCKVNYKRNWSIFQFILMYNFHEKKGKKGKLGENSFMYIPRNRRYPTQSIPSPLITRLAKAAPISCKYGATSATRSTNTSIHATRIPRTSNHPHPQ